MSVRNICSECVKKQEEIYRLREEVKRLKAQIRCQDRKITEGYFGSSTPSSKVPVKKNSEKKSAEKNRGGAKAGHKGNGRHSAAVEHADRVKEIKVENRCPKCDCSDLKYLNHRERTVIDYEIKRVTTVYLLERKQCKKCGTFIQAKTPGVLPKNLYGNRLLAHIATEHYVNGIRLGHLERQTGVNIGSLIKAMHKLGNLLKDVPDKLITDYRQTAVKHADETGWRNDGKNGYCWMYGSKDIAIFRFRGRSGQVVKEVLGSEKLPGVLVVDRYKAYNKAPCNIQYCYAHLLRDVQDLEKEFPDNKEIKAFVQTSAPLIAEAMNLRSLPISDEEFYKRAANTKEEIMKIMNSEANHPGIQKIQDIFRENSHRLYHWANNRDVPADNNFAERELRPLVIARKVSFGSHSGAGLKTRETLMTVLKTLQIRMENKTETAAAFAAFLDRLAENSELNAFECLFGNKQK